MRIKKIKEYEVSTFQKQKAVEFIRNIHKLIDELKELEELHREMTVLGCQQYNAVGAGKIQAEKRLTKRRKMGKEWQKT